MGVPGFGGEVFGFGDVDGLGAGAYGGQQRGGSGGDEDEQAVGRWLFEGLEEDVLGVGIEAVGEEDDAGGESRASDAEIRPSAVTAGRLRRR